MAKVVSINTSEIKGVIKEPIECGYAKINYGLEGDAHGGDWHRQISLLGIESFKKIEDKVTVKLVPGIFAENITTEGINLYELPVGTKMSIGDALLEITQIGKECHEGCAIMKCTGQCVMPKEGIFTKVLKEGFIYPGDEIRIIY